jgi:hypothetical protein
MRGTHEALVALLNLGIEARELLVDSILVRIGDGVGLLELRKPLLESPARRQAKAAKVSPAAPSSRREHPVAPSLQLVHLPRVQIDPSFRRTRWQPPCQPGRIQGLKSVLTYAQSRPPPG